MTSSFIKLAGTLGCALFLLVSCGKSPDSVHQRYEQRLAEGMSLDYPAPRLMPPPVAAKTSAPIEADTTIDFTTFSKLKQCHVQTLVAERNTVSGKVQAPSQRLIYDRRFLQALQQCLTIATEPDWQQQLQNWISLKRQHSRQTLARVFDNSEEFKQAWLASSKTIDINNDYTASILALNYLHQLILKPDTVPNSAELENHLSAIVSQKLLARLLHTYHEPMQRLAQQTDWLVEHQQHFRCNNGILTSRIKQALIVFRTYFIKDIQATGSHANGVFFKVTAFLKELARLPYLQPWVTDNVNLLLKTQAEYQQTLRQHVNFWQQVHQQCKVKPGQH